MDAALIGLNVHSLGCVFQLEQKLEQATEKGKAAEKEYMDAVNNANQIAREVFQNHLPPMLDELQDIEFQREGTLLGALNVLSSLQVCFIARLYVARFVLCLYARSNLPLTRCLTTGLVRAVPTGEVHRHGHHRAEARVGGEGLVRVGRLGRLQESRE